MVIFTKEVAAETTAVAPETTITIMSWSFLVIFTSEVAAEMTAVAPTTTISTCEFSTPNVV